MTSNDLLDRVEVCRLFGGSKPIDPATLYRGIKAKRYPKPIKVGPNSSRWLRNEVLSVLEAMKGARNG
jgi:predicted DNA-binding transcriptional regulator AlpA